MIMNEVKKSLYIPVNTPDADDYISGIGKVELGIILLILFLSMTLGAAMYFLNYNIIFAFGGPAFLIALTILLVRRDHYNENLIKKIKIMVNFQWDQKVYNYHYYNIYEA